MVCAYAHAHTYREVHVWCIYMFRYTVKQGHTHKKRFVKDPPIPPKATGVPKLRKAQSSSAAACLEGAGERTRQAKTSRGSQQRAGSGRPTLVRVPEKGVRAPLKGAIRPSREF